MKPLHLTYGHTGKVGSDNAEAVFLIDTMTRDQLNAARKAGGFPDLCRPLIEDAFRGGR